MNVASGAGKLKKSLDSTVDAVERHQLNEDAGAAIIREASRLSEPAEPELARAIGSGRTQPVLPAELSPAAVVEQLPLHADPAPPEAEP